MKKAKVKVIQGEKQQIESDLVLKKGKVYMPKNKELRAEITWLYHDVPVVGYGGKQKMVELVARNYQWPGVIRDIERYMEEYDLYQWIKNRMGEITGKLKLEEVPEKLQIHILVDFITKLLIVAGKDEILVVYDKLSKITYFVVTIEGTMAEGLARLFRDNIWRLHRLLESVVSDRGLQFAVELTKELNRMLDIETRLSTAFYLQIDKQIE